MNGQLTRSKSVSFQEDMKKFSKVGNFTAAANGGSGSGSSGFPTICTPWFVVSTFFSLSLVALLCVALWQSVTASQANTGQNMRIAAIETDYIAADGVLNTSLCTKIMNVNSTIQAEIDALRTFLNITGNMTANFTQYVVNTLNNLTNGLSNETMARITKDMMLMSNVSNLVAQDAAFQANLTALYLSAVFTINGLPPISGNINIVNQTGIRITNGMATVAIGNTGVVTVNAQSSDPTSRDLQLLGVGMIAVHPGNISSAIEVDGTTLATAINNLDMTTSVINMKIAQLNATDMDLQTQINAINFTSIILSIIMNDSTFNMTIASLINNITLLQQQVTALQVQLANATSFSVATGTIVPWSGTSANIPTGYLYCDGSVVSQATYPNLYTAIGCAYCAGMTCSMSNFCVPDLRGKIPAAVGGSAFLTRGAAVGEEQHTLITSEMPSHSHTTQSAGDHAHTLNIASAGAHQHHLKLTAGCGTANQGLPVTQSYEYLTTFTGGLGGGGGFVGIAFGDANNLNVGSASGSIDGSGNCNFPGAASPFGPHTRFRDGAESSGSHTHTGSTTTNGAHTHTVDASGSGASHNVIQPSVVVGAYMIKI